MHPYIIGGKKPDIRQKVTVRLVTLSIIISFLLNAGLDCLKNNYSDIFIGVNSFLQNWPFLGYSIGGYITMFVVLKILDCLFNNFIWKWPIVNRFLGVPNFSGEWRGELFSSYVQGQSFSIQMTIKQTWKEISIISSFEKSSSGSDYAIINPDYSLGKMLKFSYSNKSADASVGQTEHSGLNELYLEQPDAKNVYQVLRGTYFNNRGSSGNKGSMELRRV